MKRAEEWSEDLYNAGSFETKESAQIFWIKFLQQIQLDAWKDGMECAANIAENIADGDSYWIKEKILDAAEARKEIKSE